jgi:hypothetical protein
MVAERLCGSMPMTTRSAVEFKAVLRCSIQQIHRAGRATLHGIAASHQQGVSLLNQGDPKLLIDAGQRGEFQYSKGLPTQFGHGAEGLSSADQPPCMAGTAGLGVRRGGNAEGTGLSNRFAKQLDQR